MHALALATIVALTAAAQHTMPKGMSHEEHLKQMAKDGALRKRGAEAMGFDQDATTHHFRLAADGGSIEVSVKDAANADMVAAVRTHLQAIARDFARGDFSKPFQTHDEMPPGAAAMRRDAQAIAYRYLELPAGGAVRIVTRNRRALAAVHEFLRYQISEHRTGDATR